MDPGSLEPSQQGDFGSNTSNLWFLVSNFKFPGGRSWLASSNVFYPWIDSARVASYKSGQGTGASHRYIGRLFPDVNKKFREYIDGFLLPLCPHLLQYSRHSDLAFPQSRHTASETFYLLFSQVCPSLNNPWITLPLISFIDIESNVIFGSESLPWWSYLFIFKLKNLF